MKSWGQRLRSGVGSFGALLLALFALGFLLFWTDANFYGHTLQDRLPRPVFRRAALVYGKIVPGFYRSLPPYTVF